MKKKRIAINGFGRIGRAVARIILQHHSDHIQLVAINDPSDAASSIHLFQFDTNWGRYTGKCAFLEKESAFSIDDHIVKYFSTKEITALPWKELDIDVVIESTGKFVSKEDCELHLKQGAKKVLLSSPPKTDGFKTIVIGVNDETLTEEDLLVSCASCTTNCLGPITKVINDHFQIETAFMTTVHSYTNDQRILDVGHRDLRRARAAALNIIPTSTGAAKAIGKIIPSLDKKMNGISIRVPTPTVSIVDLVAKVSKKTTVEEVNATLKKASDTMPMILGYEERPLVSMDYKLDSRSSIVDAKETMVINDLVKVFSWYDNEWGYSNRMVDLVQKM